MRELIRNAEDINNILAKWQTAFELDAYDIRVEFVPFGALNKSGINQGLFVLAVTGGFKSPLIIKIASDWSSYKNNAIHKQHDELTILDGLMQIKRTLLSHPNHYDGAYKHRVSSKTNRRKSVSAMKKRAKTDAESRKFASGLLSDPRRRTCFKSAGKYFVGGHFEEDTL